MKTLIYFASKTGATAESVEKLAKLLKGHEVTVIRHGKKMIKPDLKEFDCIVLGGSIHMGKLQKPISRFAAENCEILKKKKLGLFLGCLTPTDKADQFFIDNFPAEVLKKASAKGLFGGAVYYEKMSFFERYILRKINGKNNSFTAFLDKNIEQFVKELG